MSHVETAVFCWAVVLRRRNGTLFFSLSEDGMPRLFAQYWAAAKWHAELKSHDLGGRVVRVSADFREVE